MNENNTVNMMNDNALTDETSRKRIKTELDKNFFVEAGAGSGKTTLLVKRMVALIKNGADISRIAAITFTKAAAREFYGRFQKALDREAHDDENSDIEKERCAAALRDIDLCFLNTIDSFCQTVMNEHPVETGIRFGSRVVTDDETDAVRVRVFEEALRGELDVPGEPSLVGLYDQMASFQREPRDAVLNGMGMFFGTRDMKRFVPEYEALDVDGEVSGFMPQLRRMINALQKDREKFYYYGDKNASGKLDSLLKESGVFFRTSWNVDASGLMEALNSFLGIKICALPDGVTTQLFKPIKSTKGYTGYRVDEESDEAEKITHVIALLEKQQYMTYTRFMDAFTRAAAKRLHERGELDYFDYLHSLRDSLRSDAQTGGQLARHIFSRHSWYLIDEFQDTDPVQAEIFFRLTAREPCDDWRECRPLPGSLFIVGDPKQSIYRFKNADVGAFLRVRAMFSDPEVGEVLYLYRNFRSVPKLRAWFNGIFTQTLQDGEYQSRFMEIPKNRDEDKVDHSGLFEGVGGFALSDSERSQFPSKVANIIENITDNDDHMIWDRDKGRRRIRYSDVMIITRNTTGQNDLIREFSERGIPYIVEGTTEFDRQPELKALTAVFGALANPTDGAYVFAALTGDAFGLTEDDIRSAMNDGLVLRLGVPKRGRKAKSGAPGAIAVLDELLSESAGLTPYAMFIRAAERLREQPTMNEAHAQSREDYFWYAAELLRSAETEGKGFGARAVYDLLLSLPTGELEREMALETDVARVHIANLHKVKGLEAPVVILMGGKSTTHKETILNDYGTEPPECTILNVVKTFTDYQKTYATIGGYDTEDGSYDENVRNEKEASKSKKKAADDSAVRCSHRRTAKEQADAEKVRIDYVAATRARSALIVCGVHGEQKGEISAILASSNWGALYPWDPTQMNDPEYWKDLSAEYALDIRGETEDNSVSESAQQAAADETGESASVLITEQLEPCTAKSYERRLPSRLVAPRKETDEDISAGMLCDAESIPDADAPESKSRKKADAALTGTLVHRAMELLVLSGCEYEPEPLAERVVSEFELTEAQRIAAKASIIKVVKQLVNRGGFRQQSRYGADIVTELKAADEVMCETPFCVRMDDADGRSVICDGVIDLIYRKDGEWHIVDYKTNADGDGLEEHYAGQLEAYREAFRRATGEQAQTHIYHIEL